MDYFEVNEIKPCADYDGVTLEGRLLGGDDFKLGLCGYLSDIAKKKIILDDGKIMIFYLEQGVIYLYDDGKFVMSQIESEESGLKLLGEYEGERKHVKEIF